MNRTVTTAEVEAEIERTANTQRDEVIRLRVEKAALAPVYPGNRTKTGTASEKLDQALAEIQARKKIVQDLQAQLTDELSKNWSVAKAIDLASGGDMIASVCRALGVAFQRESGDGAKLARIIEAIHPQVQTLLRDVIGPAR